MNNLDITAKPLGDTCVQLKCVLNAPAERVYRAWTTPTEVARWFAPAPETTCVVNEMDVRVGGKFALSIHVDNETHSVAGEYLTLNPYTLIKFSWNGCGATDTSAPSEVTVALSTLEGKTELTLTHALLEDAESRNRHMQGWLSCLGGLVAFTSELMAPVG